MTTAVIVQTLHRINRQKSDLKSQLVRGPRTVAVAEGKLKAAQQHAQDLQDQLRRSKIDVDSKQLQMKEREDKIVNLQGKMNAAKENREYQALKDQIAADSQANVVLSDEILELLELIDEQTAAVALANEVTKEVALELDAVTKRVADRKVVLESELARVEKELAEAEKNLTGDFKREYERLVCLKGEDAMAELEGKCCGGCYQSLTPQLLDQLLVGNPIICPACGRLIYQDR
ncbi:MAG: hypothetical protein KDB22_28375 [Planctomycetales bacterium]|nr:hypothetical protein [Planctomycetales bacterium]